MNIIRLVQNKRQQSLSKEKDYITLREVNKKVNIIEQME